jgi:hypothetical protein
MNRYILVIACLLSVELSKTQICQNPEVRMQRNRETFRNKDSLYRTVQIDLAIINPQPHDTIADIGSYDGYYPLAYSIFSDSVMFYLSDISRAGFAYFDSLQGICQEMKIYRGSNQFKVVIGEAKNTKLPRHLFNKVILRDALHHFTQMDEMLADIRLIMKPSSAVLYLYEPLRIPLAGYDDICKGAMGREDWLEELDKMGFVLIREFTVKQRWAWFEFGLKLPNKLYDPKQKKEAK